MTAPGTSLYIARVRTAGSRDHGIARSADGRLDVLLSLPGRSGGGTNPEQLFAAAWSACFLRSMAAVARQMGIALPADLAIDAEIELVDSPEAALLRARLVVTLPRLDRAAARLLLDRADHACPYARAIRGVAEVSIGLAGPGPSAA